MNVPRNFQGFAREASGQEAKILIHDHDGNQQEGPARTAGGSRPTRTKSVGNVGKPSYEVNGTIAHNTITMAIFALNRRIGILLSSDKNKTQFAIYSKTAKHWTKWRFRRKKCLSLHHDNPFHSEYFRPKIYGCF